MKEKKQSLTSQIIKNSLWKLFSSLITRGGALVFTILLARFLLPENFGTYNLAISIAFIFMAFFHKGFNETFLRYMSEAFGKKNKENIKSFFRYLLKIKFLCSILFSLTLLFLAYPLSYYIFKKPTLFLPLLFSAVYIFVFSFDAFLNSLFFALKKIKYIFIKEIISQTGRIIFALLIFFTISSVYYVSGIIFGLIITSLFVLFFGLYYVHKSIPFLFEKSEKISRKNKKRILKFLKYIIIGAFSFIFFGYIDTIMIGLLIENTSFIGYYRSAFVLVSSLGGLLTFSYVLLPVFVQIKKEKIEKAFNRVFRYSMIIAFPATFGTIVLSKHIIRMIYGYAYLPASIPLYFLSFLITFGVIVDLFLNLFSALEKPKAYFPLLIIIIFFNILLNYLLIITLSKHSLIMGVAGAGIATIISWSIYAIGLGVLSKKVLNVKINLKPLIKPLFSSIIMALIIFFTIKYVEDITIIIGLLEIILGILVYIITMLLMGGISKEDILLLEGYLRKKI